MYLFSLPQLNNSLNIDTFANNYGALTDGAFHFSNAPMLHPTPPFYTFPHTHTLLHVTHNLLHSTHLYDTSHAFTYYILQQAHHTVFHYTHYAIIFILYSTAFALPYISLLHHTTHYIPHQYSTHHTLISFFIFHPIHSHINFPGCCGSFSHHHYYHSYWILSSTVQ